MAYYEYKQYKVRTDTVYARKIKMNQQLGIRRWKRFKQMISKKKKVQVAVDEDADVDLSILTEQPSSTIFETRMKPRATYHPPSSNPSSQPTGKPSMKPTTTIITTYTAYKTTYSNNDRYSYSNTN